MKIRQTQSSLPNSAIRHGFQWSEIYVADTFRAGKPVLLFHPVLGMKYTIT